MLALFKDTEGTFWEMFTDLSDFKISLEVLLLIGIDVVFNSLRLRLDTLIF